MTILYSIYFMQTELLLTIMAALTLTLLVMLLTSLETPMN